MSFLNDIHEVIAALDSYYRESKAAKKPVINLPPIENIISQLEISSLIKKGNLKGENLRSFLLKYLAFTTRLHHPGYLAHQVAVPHYAGALGSLIDGFTNNPMAIYEMGPGATGIEFYLINWLLTKIGWRPLPLPNGQKDKNKIYGGGVLMHGGSLANLTALIAARNKIAPEAWKKGNPNDLAILIPTSSHYSIARAAGILGIGHNALYHLEVNNQEAIIPDALPQAYQQLMNQGKRPLALVANACSTSVGIYDPLLEIGEFCEENKIWFHIDGAHGASALLSPKYKSFFKGVEKADSLTWDAHKLMRVPVLCTALLMRDHKTIDTAFQQEASYLFHDKEQPGMDFIHKTIECTKSGLGLKLFMVLAALGEQGLAEYYEKQIEITLRCFNYINQLPDFVCAVKPQSNILCFRFEGDHDQHLQIRNLLIAEGNYYLSTTLFQNQRYLRLVFMNPFTCLEDIKTLIQRIRELK